MAYTDYTPSASAALFPLTITIPDDAEMETSGVGAFNTALEQLGNRTESAIYQFRGTFTATQQLYTLAPFTVIDTTTGDNVNVGGTDCTIGFGIRDVDDYITCHASFSVQTGLSDTTVSLITRVGAGIWAIRHELFVPASTFTLAHLQCTVIAASAGLHEAAVLVTNDATPGTTVIRGGLMFTGHVWRSTPP